MNEEDDENEGNNGGQSTNWPRINVEEFNWGELCLGRYYTIVDLFQI